MTESKNGITELYRAMRAGDESAKEELYEKIYSQLLNLAKQMVASENPGPVMTARGLVNEAYGRLAKNLPSISDRHHLQAIYAEKMRNIRIDWARQRRAICRNAEIPLIDEENFPEPAVYPVGWDHDIEVDEALQVLIKDDPLAAQIFKLCYFGGYTREQAAQILDISLDVCKKRYLLAKGKLAVILKK